MFFCLCAIFPPSLLLPGMETVLLKLTLPMLSSSLPSASSSVPPGASLSLIILHPSLLQMGLPHPPTPLPQPFLTLINGILLLCFHQSFPSFFVSSPHPTPPPHALGCTLTCGILALQPGIKPTPPAVEEWSLNHWTTREVPRVFHLCIFIPLLSTENYKWGVCVCVCVSVWEREMEREGKWEIFIKKKKRYM